MQTSLADFVRDTAQGKRADEILRACVHCGFCNATCPTYTLLGDELDGPRGRIYLIKQALEGQAVSAKTRLHLDRCLTCRACETTCPSGVNYGELVEIGRELVDERVPRGPFDRLLRWGMRATLPHRRRFALLARLGRLVSPILPRSLTRQLGAAKPTRPAVASQHPRRVLLPRGCVQPGLAPGIDAAATRVLDRLDITAVAPTGDGCCGALSLHLGAADEARAWARKNIDAWWPDIESGAEAVIYTSSACGLMVKQYASLMRDDAEYAARAARVATLGRDMAEILASEDTARLKAPPSGPHRIAFHAPCTLQHGQRLDGVTETLLRRLGFELTPVPDRHLCCGAAGPYALLQRDLSRRLLRDKLAALQSGRPDAIATANIGCLTHMRGESPLPVRHWIELIDAAR